MRIAESGASRVAIVAGCASRVRVPADPLSGTLSSA
jgi:hypothetical protein